MSETVADDPKLAALWDAAKNAKPANETLATSYAAASWRCPIGHAFERSPRAMQMNPACPLCKETPKHANLVKLRPALASLWDAEKNAGLAIGNVDATGNNPLWWRCPNGHGFQRAPVRMLSDDTCPTCALAGSSLAAVAPEVAAEWHPS